MPPMLTLITRAPASTPATMPAARSVLATPPVFETLIGITEVSAGYAEAPDAVAVDGADQPSHEGAVSDLIGVLVTACHRAAGQDRPARSGWSASTPESTTATGASGAPPPAAAIAARAPTASWAQAKGRPVGGRSPRPARTAAGARAPAPGRRPAPGARAGRRSGRRDRRRAASARQGARAAARSRPPGAARSAAPRHPRAPRRRPTACRPAPAGARRRRPRPPRRRGRGGRRAGRAVARVDAW